jgi:hypothetical protein
MPLRRRSTPAAPRSDPRSADGIVDRRVAHARETAHPEQKGRSVFEVFEAERPSLIAYPGAFDGFHETQVAVCKSSLVRFDHNRYSVAVKAARRPAQLRAYWAPPDPPEGGQRS